MPVLFKLKTADGYSMKILSELLQNNLKTALFTINAKGIFLRMFDPRRRILIDLVLKANKFNLYKYKSAEENLYIGVSLANFHKMMKTIKKKDSLVLKIDSDEPANLIIRVIPKENPGRVSESVVKLHTTQNIETDLPGGYGRTVINLTSTDFQKACKEVAIAGNVIKVSSQGLQIKFLCDATNIYYKSVSFGEADDSDPESGEEGEETPGYKQNFDADQLLRITKISGLATNMQIFAKEGRPLLFKSRVGNLGHISVYLRSKEQLEEEEEEEEEDD